MIYIIRDCAGAKALALTFKGALAQLPQLAGDAAIYTFTGRWIAGRRLEG